VKTESSLAFGARDSAEIIEEIVSEKTSARGKSSVLARPRERSVKVDCISCDDFRGVRSLRASRRPAVERVHGQDR